MKEFRLPDPGEGLVEAEIVNWLVAVGDEVKVNDVVVEVETSKSLVELPIPFAGTVAELLVSEGDTVDVGRPIIVIDDGAGAAEKSDESEKSVESDEVDDKPVPNLVGYGAKSGSLKRRARTQAASAAEPAADQTHQQLAQVFDQGVPVSRRYDEHTPIPPLQAEATGAPLPSPGRHEPSTPPVSGVLAKPPVRKLAKDRGVDLSTLSGSGEGGIITREDVERAAAGAAADARPGASTPRPVTATAEDQRIPVKGVRKITAEAMVASAFTAPHVTEWVTCDVTGTMELLDTLKAHPDFAGVRVSPTLWVARAALLALRRNPSLNSSWDEEAGEIVQHGRVNLGLAAATPRGLMVPNIKDAGALSLRELAQALNELVDVAKAGRTQPADTSGGTFTLTNVGVFGVDGGTPIINPGEGAILCMGAIDRRPWVVGTGASERIEPRWVTTVAVSFDHRMIDGEQGSKFLADVARLLRDPAAALLE